MQFQSKSNEDHMLLNNLKPNLKKEPTNTIQWQSIETLTTR